MVIIMGCNANGLTHHARLRTDMTEHSSSLATSGTVTSIAEPGRYGSPCTTCQVRETAFCGVLSDSELDRLNAISGQFRYKPPQVIVFEGDDAAHIFNVQRGVVRLTKMLSNGRRQITGFLFPGDFIGLATRDQYAYSAEAVTDVELCRFPRNRFVALLADLPELEHRLLSMAADDLASAQEQMVLLGRKTARERLVSFLLRMAGQMERRGLASDTVDLPMARADIADYLGLTIETVSRTLTKLVKEGLIALPAAQSAVLVQRAALEAIDSGDIDDGFGGTAP